MTANDALSARRLSYTAGGRLIIDGVDCTAPAGSVTGVLGPNGSGKSTLLRLLVGAFQPDDGVILLAGEDLRRLERRERARRITHVEQESAPEVPLPVRDVVLLGRIPHRSRWAPDSERDLAAVNAALARVGGSELAHRAFGTLSGGERQRVRLAAALAQEPQLLLLDEPANHLDVAGQLELLELVRDLAAEGVSLVMALHDLNHALRICRNVIVLAGGRVRAAGLAEQVLSPELVREVYGVRADIVQVGPAEAGGRVFVFGSPTRTAGGLTPEPRTAPT